MKKIVSFIILGLIVISCRPKDEYIIKGTISDKDLNGEYVVMYTVDNFETTDVDSAFIKNNKFEFKGRIEEPTLYFMFIDAQGVYDNLALGVPILIQPGELTVKIEGNGAKIKGNAENENYQELIGKQAPILERMNEIDKKAEDNLSEEELNRLQAEYSELYEQTKINLFDYVRENINNPLGEKVFFDNYHLLTNEEIEEVVAAADESFASHPIVVEILAQREKMKSKFAQGTKYMDFTLPDKNGKKVSLSDYAGKGKYILIDFWASWCPPCMREMADLVDFYNSLKGKNFEIIGVSLDEDKTKWTRTLSEYNMTWPQLCDFTRNNEAVVTYQVESIPYTVLIDPQGNIIADNLRGVELENFILNVLNPGN